MRIGCLFSLPSNLACLGCPARYRTVVQEFPKAAYTTPLGVASVRRPGSDVTLVGWGPSVDPLVAAADAVETEYGIQPEVIDLRTLAPWDVEAIEASVNKTGRLLVSHEVCLPPASQFVTQCLQLPCAMFQHGWPDSEVVLT